MYPAPPARCQQVNGNRHGKILTGPYSGHVTVQWDRKHTGPTVSRNNNGTVDMYVPLTDIEPEQES